MLFHSDAEKLRNVVHDSLITLRVSALNLSILWKMHDINFLMIDAFSL
jgi:hypothetical protein